MNIEKAIEIIQKDIDDKDVEWDSPLGEAYKLSFEALKAISLLREGTPGLNLSTLPGESPEEEVKS